MKLRLLLIPVLMTSAMFAQDPGGFNSRRGQLNGPQETTTSTTSTPPTAEQLATREVNLISTVLRLTTAQTSALLSNLACASSASTVTSTSPCALTAEQNVLEANAATLKTDWAALSTELTSTPPTSTSTTVSAINAVELSNLEARVAAAGAVMAELGNLKVTLTAAQQTRLINALVRGEDQRGFRR